MFFLDLEIEVLSVSDQQQQPQQQQIEIRFDRIDSIETKKREICSDQKPTPQRRSKQNNICSLLLTLQQALNQNTRLLSSPLSFLFVFVFVFFFFFFVINQNKKGRRSN